jgi:hypothetical protein
MKDLAIERFPMSNHFRRLLDAYTIDWTIEHSDTSRPEAIHMMEELFLELDWEHRYGGKAWSNICDAWIKLYNAKTPEEIIIWVDHIYDLQHNSGVVFNKLDTYKEHGMDVTTAYNWLKKALDKKKNMENIFDLVSRASPKMKEVGTRAAKERYHETEESYQVKERKKREKELGPRIPIFLRELVNNLNSAYRILPDEEFVRQYVPKDFKMTAIVQYLMNPSNVLYKVSPPLGYLQKYLGLDPDEVIHRLSDEITSKLLTDRVFDIYYFSVPAPIRRSEKFRSLLKDNLIWLKDVKNLPLNQIVGEKLLAHLGIEPEPNLMPALVPAPVQVAPTA